MMNKCIPTRCIDPVVKYCQGCKYGYCIYPEWVESYEDFEFCYFGTGCLYGLENTVPTEKEQREYEEDCKRVEELRKKDL